MTSQTTNYWFILGHEPLLSLAELHGILRATPHMLTQEIARIPSSSLNPRTLITQLGGTIKIAAEIGYGLDEESLLNAMANDLEDVYGKIHFGLSLHAVPNGAKQAEQWGLTLKKRLKAAKKSVRYVDNRGKAILSSVSVDKNGLADRGREFIVVPEKKLFKLARTLVVQPFEAFGERDFGRPGRDDLSGMLPPKLAMMMVNCAGIPKNKTLYDPSCGSGTILSEAMLLGYTKLIGSDVSAKAVEDTKRNIVWTKDTQAQYLENKDQAVTVFEHDIQKAPKEVTTKELGGIVSEPFLGPPLKGNELSAKLVQNARDLAKLYLTTFKSFASFLPKGASVIYIFPRFSATVRTAELVIPEIKKLGFKVVPLLPSELSKEPYILYQRENQRIGREIWKFIF